MKCWEAWDSTAWGHKAKGVAGIFLFLEWQVFFVSLMAGFSCFSYDRHFSNSLIAGVLFLLWQDFSCFSYGMDFSGSLMAGFVLFPPWPEFFCFSYDGYFSDSLMTGVFCFSYGSIFLFLLWHDVFCVSYGRHSSVSFMAEALFCFFYGRGILLFLLWQAFFCFYYGRHSSVCLMAEAFFFFCFSHGRSIISRLKDITHPGRLRSQHNQDKTTNLSLANVLSVTARWLDLTEEGVRFYAVDEHPKFEDTGLPTPQRRRLFEGVDHQQWRHRWSVAFSPPLKASQQWQKMCT